MAVYMIIETLEVFNIEKASQYVTQARPIIESFGGEYLASSEDITPLGGNWTPKRMIIIKFPDMETFRKCFDSPEYKAIVQLRLDSIKGKSVIVPGL